MYAHAILSMWTILSSLQISSNRSAQVVSILKVSLQQKMLLAGH